MEDFLEYHRIAFRYLRWVISRPLNEAFDKVFERNVGIIAPVHGNPITDRISQHVQMMKDVNSSLCMGRERKDRIPAYPLTATTGRDTSK